ncbi:MAG TPA: DUF4276 family protein [Thermoanaerobaculia bacterium]|nr:DUF4276 family protein [Thermoanaerobaculia bacterium]
MIVQPIVEGQGEEAAVPVLLRMLRDQAQAWTLQIARPHRRRRSQLVKKDTLQTAVRVAALKAECAAIIVILDADDDCPAELAPKMQEWANEAAGAKTCAIVIANREYEAWLLASIETLRGRRSFLADAEEHRDPERPRDAKGELERRMQPGSSYSPSVDQAAMTAHLEPALVYSRCRSFRKLVKTFGEIAAAAGAPIGTWPPAGWQA